MARTSRVNIFDPSKSELQIIWALAWPVILENVLSTLVSYADTAMVGSLGSYATAAVSLCNPAMFLITGAVLAMGTGLTALVARAVGAKDHATIKKLTSLAFVMIIFMGFPMCIIYGAMHRILPIWMGAGADVLEYSSNYNLIVACGRPFFMASAVMGCVFRGSGDTKTSLYVNLMVNVINIIGNYFLIYESHMVHIFGWEFMMPGAGWGVSGAAAATAISMAVGGIVMVSLAFLRDSIVKISIHDKLFHVDWKLFKRVWSISLPTLGERVFNCLGGIMISSTVALLGTTALAVNTLHTTSEQIVQMPIMGTQNAAMTLVGQYLGAKQSEKAEHSVRSTIKYGMIGILVMSTLLFIFAPWIVSIFTPDLEVRRLTTRCVRIMCFAQPASLIALTVAGALRGAGDTRITLYIIAATNWIIRIFGTILCIRFLHLGDGNIDFGINLIIIFTVAEVTIRAVLFVFRFRTGKWKTKLKD